LKYERPNQLKDKVILINVEQSETDDPETKEMKEIEMQLEEEATKA
jgi:hypothetical protein